MDLEGNPTANQAMIGENASDEEIDASLRTEITDDQRQNLVSEAQTMHDFFQNFDRDFNDADNEYFYVISARWLRKWKKYTSYNAVVGNTDLDVRWFGQAPPGRINEDITEESPKFSKYPDENDYRNVFLKGELQEKRDYELLTRDAWNYISNRYEHIEVERPSFMLNNGMKSVEVSLKKIQIVPVNNSFLKDVDHKRTHDFKVFIIQTSGRTELTAFKKSLAKASNSRANKKWFESQSSYYSTFYENSEENIRLWKLDPTTTLKDFFKDVKEVTENSRTYDYKIEFKGQYLEKEKDIKVEDAQLAENDYLFIECREQNKGWNFNGDGAPILAKCEYCNKYGELPVQCSCKKVAYCSEDCKISDKRFHRSRCEKAGEDDEEESKALAEKPDSKKGLVGLQNLGNTCFMNSGLQCMSNVQELTKYFLEDKYLAEINETNPLGTKGKLVKKYATFLKHLWFGTSGVYSPWALKQGISEFQPMFSGYQQHDSQELLAFLIDGIHEDLNRVKVKPFTETIESNDQADYEVAQKSWANHLKRNQSIIVDLLHGQYKSQITCPTCDRVSITFDPFNSVSLPIQMKKDKEIDLFFIHANNKTKAVKLSFTFPKTTHTVSQLKQEIATKLEKDPKNFYFVLSNYHSKEIIADEDKMLTNELRKKKRFKNLFAFEDAQEDRDADPEDRIDVSIHPTKKAATYYGSELHKPVSFIRSIILRKSYNLRQVYFKTFKYYRFLFDENWPEDEGKEDWLKLSDEEAFDKIWVNAEEKPFFMHIVTNFSMSQKCFFCGESRCDNCKLPYDDSIKLSDILDKIKDPDYTFELEIVFDALPSFVSLEGLNGYVDLSKRKSSTGGDDTTPKEKGLSIYDCFEQFEKPEQLGEENAWYCSQCKSHQRATKKMEIYKAPPVLILHFKRFKSGNSYFKKGKITEKVEFPCEDFDISDYVLNHEVPMDYTVERIVPDFTVQTAPEANPEDPANVANANTITVEEKAVKTMTPTKSKPAQNNMNIEGGDAAAAPNSKLLYNLFAVVNHYGNLGFGHYTAYAKNFKNEKWHYFDDSKVTEESSGNNVCTPAAYVLFYKRKDWDFKL